MCQFLSHCSIYVLQPTKVMNISENTKLCRKIFQMGFTLMLSQFLSERQRKDAGTQVHLQK